MSWLTNKTETVILLDKAEIGRDAFGAPIYETREVSVSKVLVDSLDGTGRSHDISGVVNLSGKKIVYELCIPKNDNNTWEDRDVIVRGKKYHTSGALREWINPPMEWNKKIMVERYE